MGFWSVSRWMMSKACSTMRTCADTQYTKDMQLGQPGGRPASQLEQQAATGLSAYCGKLVHVRT
jgi:hypothetical protein